MKEATKSPVRLRAKELKNGNKSLYLDCYVNGHRSYEFLKLYLIPEHSPLDKERNKTTKMQAEAHKAKRVIEIQQGKYGVVQGCKLNRVLLSDYVMQIGATKNKATKGLFENTAQAIREYKDTQLQQVDKNYLEGFIDFLKNGHTYFGRVNKESTQAIKLHKLNCTLNCAVREGVISSNPMQQLDPAKKPRASKQERDFLTLQEVEKLVATECKRGTIKRAFLFCCFCGLRYSDVKQLTWGDIKETTEGGKQLIIKQQKTQQVIYVPLSDNALKWLPQQPEASTSTDLVFPLLPITQCMRRQLVKWSKDAGLTKHLHFHMSRHTFATLLLTYGVDLYTVSKLLGHTDISTTQIYAKIVDSKKAEAVNLIPTL